MSVMLLASGCVGPKDPLEKRKRSYQELASLIQPGMTRRQLYALLPPKTVPHADPPGRVVICGIPLYSPHHEIHALDKDFQLDVEYKLASQRDLRAYERAMSARLKEITVELGSLKRREVETNGRRPTWTIVQFPSLENLDDEIVSVRPVELTLGVTHGFIRLVSYGELYVTP